MEKIIEETLEQMIEFQRNKVFKIAREINSKLTLEDIRNPQDFPVLYNDPIFNYEDGILAGYLSVQIALRSKQGKDSN